MTSCLICGKLHSRRKYCSNECRLQSKRLTAREWNNKNKFRRSKLQKEWRKANIEIAKEHDKRSYLKNKESKSKSAKKTRQKFKTLHGISYEAHKNKSDLKFKLRRYLRSRLYNAIKQHSMIGYIKVGSHVADLGCSILELKAHLESKFQPGMTWDNYGFRGWHIDHIRPLSSFDLTDKEQLKLACHYSNLQPLWWRDNLVKSNK